MLAAALLPLAGAFTHASALQQPAQAATAARQSPAKVWVGRQVEFEECLKAARIVRAEAVPVGVTRPRRVFFETGGVCESGIFKPLRPSRDSGFFESYLSEIAAYELDKLLGLDMVPVTVERSYEGKIGSLQLWVDHAVWRRELDGERPPDSRGWNVQVRRWIVFDNLIANSDRNVGNLLVVRDPTWHLVLVDHSRAFMNITGMPFEREMQRIDRALFERLKALDPAAVEARLGKLVMGGTRSLLRRRAAIVSRFEQMARERGEAAVFTP